MDMANLNILFVQSGYNGDVQPLISKRYLVSDSELNSGRVCWANIFYVLTRLFLLFPVTSKPGSGGGYGPGGTWGLVEFIVVIAGPLFLFFLLLMGGLFLYQYHQRNYSHRQRLEVEDPSCDHLYPAKDRSLQDLIYDLSTSGSGSGECHCVKSHWNTLVCV